MICIPSSIPLWLLFFFFKPSFFLSVFLQLGVINISIISINNILNSIRHILHVSIRLINLVYKFIIFPYRTAILPFYKRRNVLSCLFLIVLLILVILTTCTILVPPVVLGVNFSFLRLLFLSLKMITPIWILIILIFWQLLILILILLPCWNHIAGIIFSHI